MLTVITNRKICKSSFLHQIEEICDSGASQIILREKDLSNNDLLALGKKVKDICDKYSTKLIINNNIEVANTLNAYGCQLSMSNIKDRYLLNKNIKVGASVHDINQVKLALENNVDYLLASHIFATDCKKGLTPKGIGFLKQIKEITDLPIIALGGITLNTIDKLKDITKNVAIMSTLMKSDNANKDTTDFIRRIEKL